VKVESKDKMNWETEENVEGGDVELVPFLYLLFFSSMWI
jgi:hypothetical protein